MSLIRDMTELSMMPKQQWSDGELHYFHTAFQQMMPYLNSEGQAILREIVEEMASRGGLKSKG
mgnify:CR=1 FL=1